MIKIVAIAFGAYPAINLTFSDGTMGTWSAADIIARATSLTAPLADADYFGRAFIEGGALAWPNGLELSPAAIHAALAESGTLRHRAA